MQTSFFDFGALLLAQMLQAAWQAGVLALVVSALTKLLGQRLHPRWRYALWLTVFIRLAVPVLPESQLSLFRFISDAGIPQPTLLIDSTFANTNLDSEGFRPWSSSAFHHNLTMEPDVDSWLVDSVANGGTSEPTIRHSWSLTELAICLWLAGMAVFLSRFVISHLQLRRQQGSWELITNPAILCLLQSCRQELCFSRSVILCASDNIGPATCGIIRPRIVVPQKLLDSLSREELRLVLLHELVHVRRRDVLMYQLATIITIIHWFHPVGWLCRRVLRSEREFACDAAVLAQARVKDPADYGHLILKAMESLQASLTPAVGLIGIFHGKSEHVLQRRIRLIANYRRPGWSQLWLGAIPLLILGVMGLTVPGCNVSQDEKPKMVVGHPEVKDVTLAERYVCQIHAHRHIVVRAAHRGYIEEIFFKDGQQVKQGDVLFRLRPIFDQVGQDTEKAANDQVVDQDVRIIKAPFDGLIGRLDLKQGSLVAEGEALTTLTDTNQMWVYFNVPEGRYLKYQADPDQDLKNAKIELILANGEKFSEIGKLGAIEAEFTSQTGTIPFRADFPNPARQLRHGQTGTVSISRVVKDAIVIPQSATFEAMQKRYVFVVDDHNIAHQREINIENEVDDSFVVKSGLSANDRIILERPQEARDGEKVVYGNRQHIPIVNGK